MRLYKIEGQGLHVRFAGSMGAAREVRQTIVNDYGVKKRDLEINEVDVPTNKDGLLRFLNTMTSKP